MAAEAQRVGQGAAHVGAAAGAGGLVWGSVLTAGFTGTDGFAAGFLAGAATWAGAASAGAFTGACAAETAAGKSGSTTVWRWAVQAASSREASKQVTLCFMGGSAVFGDKACGVKQVGGHFFGL